MKFHIELSCFTMDDKIIFRARADNFLKPGQRRIWNEDKLNG